MSLNWINKTNGIDDINADDFNNLVQSIEEEFNNKVAKEDGKVLSTNDYTNEEKSRVENSMQFKGEAEPAENASAGDTYKV